MNELKDNNVYINVTYDTEKINTIYDDMNIIKWIDIKYDNNVYNIGDINFCNKIVPQIYYHSFLPNGISMINYSLYPKSSQLSGFINIKDMSNCWLKIKLDNSIWQFNYVIIKLYYIVYKKIIIVDNNIKIYD